jgi:thiamine pyrophosphokinase
MKICYIVGAGEFAYPFIPKKDELVIAADGGYDTLKIHGIRCDLLVGDLDSVLTNYDGVPILRYKAQKDETDMQLAIMAGCERGYRSFRIYGATGGRLDHTFANLSLLLWAKKEGLDVKIVSEGALISLIMNEKITILGNTGTTFSIFAFGKDAAGVSIYGAKYPLSDACIKAEIPLGISNEFLGREITISVKSGSLLLFQNFRS